MIFNWDEEEFQKVREGLYQTLFSYPTIETEKLMVLQLMVEAWALKNISYTPYLVAENYLFFKTASDRDLFEEWHKQINLSEVPDKIITDLDIEELLNEDVVRLMGKVPYEFDGYGDQDQDFIEENHEVCLWLAQHTSNKPGERFWYDTYRESIWFENASIATNFKLRFCEDGAKPKKKNTNNNQASSNQEEDSYFSKEWIRNKLLQDVIEESRRERENRYKYDDYAKKWYDGK